MAMSGEPSMGRHDNQMLLLPSIVTLCLSWSMAWTACGTHFRWTDAWHHAAHGSLCMTLVCLGAWSFCEIVHLLAEEVHTSSPGLVAFAHGSAIAAFNAVSMWLIFATYEFQRCVWRPRAVNHLAVLVRHHVGVALVAVSVGVAEWSGDASSDQVRPANTPVVTTFIVKLSYGIRWCTVLHMLAVALALRCSDLTSAPPSIPSIWPVVAAVWLTNVPYLALEPVFGPTGVMADDTAFHLSRLATFASGFVLAATLGQHVPALDKIKQRTPAATRPRHRHPSPRHCDQASDSMECPVMG